MKELVVIWMAAMIVLSLTFFSCNNGLSPARDSGGSKKTKIDRSKTTSIDDSEYVDFTIKKNNAQEMTEQEIIHVLNGTVYRNGNSSILIKPMEGTIEISSDTGTFKGKKNCQIYGVFGFDFKAASSDCMYIRRNQQKDGFLMIDGTVYRNDEIPDLAACIPLYGFSRNRIEVSPVMDGYIVIPSGTYWKK